MPQKNRIFAISKSQSIRQAPTKIPQEPPKYANRTKCTPQSPDAPEQWGALTLLHQPMKPALCVNVIFFGFCSASSCRRAANSRGIVFGAGIMMA